MKAQCCICSDLFENASAVNIAAVHCGHTFHEVCLMRWLESSSTCPSCRTPVKKNLIIKRLFFDISEDFNEDEDLDKLVNQVGNLKAVISERDKQKQELVECRDSLTARLTASEALCNELTTKVNQENNMREVLLKDIKWLQKENSAYLTEIKEFRKAQERLSELQNIDLVLKGCESDIKAMISEYIGGGESSIKTLASMVTVVKREYSLVTADKKELIEKVSKLKRLVGHYHSEARALKQKLMEITAELERSNDTLNKLQQENNQNRRKLVHLRNALRYEKTEGSQSFHKAINEDSPNVAYTPPRKRDQENLNTTPFIRSDCLTPDLFEDKPSPEKIQKESTSPKLKLIKVPTAAEKSQVAKKARLESESDEDLKIPKSMFSILQKKMTGVSNSRTHVPTIITRGYNGLGGSTTVVHSLGPPRAQMKVNPKKKIVKKSTFFDPSALKNQPKFKDCINNCPSKSSSSILNCGNDMAPSGTTKTGERTLTSGVKKINIFKKNTPPAEAPASLLPTLTSDIDGFIDLT